MTVPEEEGGPESLVLDDLTATTDLEGAAVTVIRQSPPPGITSQ